MSQKISIVVPIYNAAKYLSDCLNSLTSQTYSNIEIVCVNDGSKDNSLELLEQYQQNDSRIKIVSQSNQGLSGARNTGLKHCTGNYVAFLDSDDWLDASALQDAISFSLANNLDIVMWSYVSEYQENSISRKLFGSEKLIWDSSNCHLIHRRLIGPYEHELSEPHKLDACVTAWGKLYKADILSGIEFVDTKEIGTEDALFNIQVFHNATRIGYLPSSYTHYRKYNAASLTSTYKSELVPRWAVLFSKIRGFLDSINASDDFYQALYNRICLSMIGIGLNELDSPRSFFGKASFLRNVLADHLWKEAYTKLDFRFLPLKWKFFFFFCAKGQTQSALLMLYAIAFLKSFIQS